MASSSAASSPQTGDRRPGPRAAAAIRARTPGSSGSATAATPSLPRSAARAYWVRSLVPMLKKSTCGANARGLQSRRGHLDHDPDAEPGGTPLPFEPGGLLERPRAASSSATVLTIGNITSTGRSRATRTTARSWSRSSSGRRSASRMPRTPEERVRLHRHRHVGQWLVAADVEGPDDDPAAGQRIGQRTVGGSLLVHARRRGAAEEQQLGADEACEVGARGRGGERVVQGAEVGPDMDRDAVPGDRRSRGGGQGGLAPSPRAAPPAARRRHGSAATGRRPPRLGCRRRRRPAPGPRPARRTCGDDRGDAERPQEDHAVGGRAPPASTTATTRSGSSAAASAGVRSSATSTAPAGGSALDCAPPGSQVRGHLVPHGADVGSAGPLVGVGQRGEGTGDRVDGAPPGRQRTESRVDAEPGAVEQVRILQEQQVRVEDGGFLLPHGGRRPLPGAPHILFGVPQRRPQPSQLLLGVADRCALVDPLIPGRGPGRPHGRTRGRRQGARRYGYRHLLRRRAGRRTRSVEIPETLQREREQAFDRTLGVRPGGGHLHHVPLRRAERGDAREAARRHGTGPGGQVAEPDVGVELVQRAYEHRRRPGVEAVRPRDVEPAGETVRALLRQQPAVLGLVVDAQLLLLGRERAACLGGHVLALGPTRGRDRGDAEPLHERCGAERHALSDLGIEQVERQRRRRARHCPDP